jgi:hypothetical protein
MQELVRPLKSDRYSWEIGEERIGGFLPVTYLIGVPADLRDHCEPAASRS